LDSKLEELASAIVSEASGILRDLFYEEGLDRVVGVGASGDTITIADKLVEEYTLSRLKSSGLELLIVSEESGLVKTSSEPKYIALVDPLDGSLNYASKIPLAAVSIVFFEASRPYLEDAVAGAVSNVFVREVFSFDGEAVYVNGRVVKGEYSRPHGIISVYTEDLNLIERIRRAYLDKLGFKPKIRTLGCASLESIYAALGRIDLFVHNTGKLRNLDVACSIGISSRLGMAVRDLHGKPLVVRADSIAFIDSIMIGHLSRLFLN